jgi:hypothetical protein
MRNASVMVLIAAVSMASAGTLAYAQSNSAPSANTTGTSPDNRGSTGWTGGSRDTKQDGAPDSDGAAQQPLTATGLDLNGPPRRFPANKTPE